MKVNIRFTDSLLDGIMLLLSCAGYFHLYRKKGTKLTIRIISVIYSSLIVSLANLWAVVQLVGSFLPPLLTYDNVLMAISLPFSYFYGPIILLGTFIQSSMKPGYYHLIEEIKMCAKNVKISHKIAILVTGLIQILMVATSFPDLYMRMNEDKDRIEKNLRYLHSYTDGENITYGYFVSYLSVIMGYIFSTYVISCALYLVQIICILLSNQFILCTEKLKQSTRDHINELEDIVCEYEKLRSLVNSADNSFIVLNGVMMTYSTISVCIMGYIMIGMNDNVDAIYYIKYMIYGVMNLFLICTSAAYLNTSVSMHLTSTLPGLKNVLVH